VAAVLSAAGLEVESLGSVQKLRHSLAARAPDLLILELGMLGRDGFDAIQELSRQHPKLAVLVLNIYSDELAVRAIAAGAAGYLAKSSPPRDLVRAVMKALKQQRLINSMLTLDSVKRLSRGGTGKEPHEFLSDREYTVMLKIAAGFTTGQIAEQLNLRPKTVGTYRARVFGKMGTSSQAELTCYVTERGLSSPGFE
jgi:two-component system invasion response regulator UvrY